MIFAVLNPDGRDSDLSFAAGVPGPGNGGHPPVNYHAYAACCGGGFFRSTASVPAGTNAVLVLLRKRNLKACLKAVRELKAARTRVLISFKESGSHQVADFLSDAGRFAAFREICGACDGALSSTPDLVELYQAAGCRMAEFLPTPYPVDVPEWDFSRPYTERDGVFVGTREFFVPSRCHAAAVVSAWRLSRDLGCPLTVFNTDGRRGRALLHPLQREHPDFRIEERKLPYADYLRLMAAHRLVLQLDTSRVPGQVAGDALLCRMPCVGGNGAVDEAAFGRAESASASLEIARRLLTDAAAWSAAVAASQERAARMLSFSHATDRIAAFATA